MIGQINLTSAISCALYVDNKLFSKTLLMKTLISKSSVKEHEIFYPVLTANLTQ
jgi:hypothetical protein